MNRLVIVLTFTAAAASGVVRAGPLEAACYNDIQKYCAGTQGGEQLKACLLKNRDSVVLTCQQTMAATYKIDLPSKPSRASGR